MWADGSMISNYALSLVYSAKHHVSIIIHLYSIENQLSLLMSLFICSRLVITDFKL